MFSSKVYCSLNENDELMLYDTNNENSPLNLNKLYSNNQLKIDETFKAIGIGIYSFKTIPLFAFLITCKLCKYEKTIKICSNIHLQKLLEKYEYKDPYFYSTRLGKDIFITKENIKTIDISFLGIDVKDKMIDDYLLKLNEKFNNIKNRYDYSKYRKSKELIYFPSNYELICDNYNKYFFINNTSTNFDLKLSNERFELINNIDDFMQNKEKNIYAICGPNGIGKSISSLIIHKNLYIHGYKSLYINFKYYLNNADFKEAIETLISECIFLFDDFNLLKELVKKIIYENKNKIWEVLFAIKELLKNHKINSLFIFDQFENNLDFYDNLSKFKDKKIFIISNINNEVKNQLILKMNAKAFSINYIYYAKLIDFSCLKDIILNSGGDNASNDIIIDKFDCFPQYVFSFINYYKSIYDLIFNEYKNIFLDMENFFIKKDYLILKELGKSKPLFYTKNEFINNMDNIPLEYVKINNSNPELNQDLYSLNYSFTFTQNVYTDYVNYIDSKSSFFSGKNKAAIGINFETIIKIRFLILGLLNIDGAFEVNSCLDLDLTNMYKGINADYFSDKKNILIYQKNSNAKLIDFIIIRPDKKVAFFIQSKYIINNSSVSHRDNYVEDSKYFVNSFESIFGIKLKRIFLLYISSFIYNNKRKEEVFDILKKKKINCLFYSVAKNYFSYNLKKKIIDLEENVSYQIFPNDNFSYEEQRDYPDDEIINLNGKVKPIDINDYKNVENVINNLSEDSIEKKEYSSFINFLFDIKILDKRQITLFNNFIIYCSNSLSFPFISVEVPLYYVHCKLQNEKINFDCDIGIIFPKNNSNYNYLDVKNCNYLNKSEYDKKFRNYGFFIGLYYVIDE